LRSAQHRRIAQLRPGDCEAGITAIKDRMPARRPNFSEDERDGGRK
jgi:hypothetical protein